MVRRLLLPLTQLSEAHMSQVLCSASTAVLRRSRTVNNTVTFISEYDDTKQIYRTLVMELDEWRSFGEPEAITVTIEPGDKLNGDGTTPIEVSLDGTDGN